jgi:ATP-dependent protease ClpP protease subunit
MAASPPSLVGRPLYVTFTAGIDQNSCDALINTMTGALSQGAKEVHLLLSTSGGGIMQGMTIFNFLRGLHIDLTTHNIGNVDSVGNVVFLAGEKRIACPSSTFMFHGVAYNGSGAYSFGMQALLDVIGGIKADEERIAYAISSRTSLQRNDVMALFSRADTKNADDALACGIIHEISDVQMPANALAVTINATSPPGR